MNVFKKLFGLVKGAVPVLAGFREIAQLIGSLIKIGVGSNDKSKIKLAIEAGRDLVFWIRDWADELEEGFDAAEAAIDEEGPGGSDITASEAIEIGDEFADVGPVLKKVGEKSAELVSKLRAILQGEQ